VWPPAHEVTSFGRTAAPALHLGTLGTGNHFIELCLDELDRVWVMRRFAVLTVKG